MHYHTNSGGEFTGMGSLMAGGHIIYIVAGIIGLCVFYMIFNCIKNRRKSNDDRQTAYNRNTMPAVPSALLRHVNLGMTYTYIYTLSFLDLSRYDIDLLHSHGTCLVKI